MDIPRALCGCGRLEYNVKTFDLGQYWKRFPDALLTRYKRPVALDLTSPVIFADISRRFEGVRSGRARLAAADVMAIFGESLPFADDWTTPDPVPLEARMTEGRGIDSAFA